MPARICSILVVFAILALSASSQNPSLFPQRVKGKYGYVDASNTVRLDYIFDQAYPFSEGYAFVISEKWGGYVRANGTWSFYDTSLVSGERMSEGIAIARRNSGSGVCDSAGKIIVPFEYDFIRRFNSIHLLLASKRLQQPDGTQKTVDHLYTFSGLKVTADFDDSRWHDEGCAIGMKQNGKYWVYGKDGKNLLGFQVDELYITPYGARVTIGKLYGAINRNGDLVLPVRYPSMWVSDWAPYASFDNESRDTSAYMDLDRGRIAFNYTAILENPVSDDVAVVSYINNVHNVYDLSGNRITQLITHEDTSRANQHKYVEHVFQMHYSDGMISIRGDDNKWYAYNKQGKLAFPKGYDAEFHFKNGVAIVRTDGYSFKYGLIDKTGKEILPLEYQDITYTGEPQIMMVKKDDKHGLVKTDGTFIFPLQPVSFAEYWDGFFFVTGGYELNYYEYGYTNTKTGMVYFSTKQGE